VISRIFDILFILVGIRSILVGIDLMVKGASSPAAWWGFRHFAERDEETFNRYCDAVPDLSYRFLPIFLGMCWLFGWAMLRSWVGTEVAVVTSIAGLLLSLYLWWLLRRQLMAIFRASAEALRTGRIFRWYGAAFVIIGIMCIVVSFLEKR